MIAVLPEYRTEILYLEREMRNNQLPLNLPSGSIHCDIKRENILVNDNRLTGVVDFDNCQIGPYLLDLAISVNWFCTSWKGLDYKKTYQFVRYYEKYRKLSRKERKLLYQAVKYAYISHEFVDFYVYAKGIITEDYFNFGRKFFIPAAMKMDRKKFWKYVESKFACLNNLI